MFRLVAPCWAATIVKGATPLRLRHPRQCSAPQTRRPIWLPMTANSFGIAKTTTTLRLRPFAGERPARRRQPCPNAISSNVVKQCPAFVTKIDEAQGIVDLNVNTFGILDPATMSRSTGMCAKSINERGRQIQVLNSHNSKRIEDVIGIPPESRKKVERDGAAG